MGIGARFSSYEIDCLKAEEEDFVAVDATVVFQFLPVTAAGRNGRFDAAFVVLDNAECRVVDEGHAFGLVGVISGSGC